MYKQYLRAIIHVDERKYGNFTRTVTGIIDNNNTMVKKGERVRTPGKQLEKAKF
jgi:hypothetical protein